MDRVELPPKFVIPGGTQLSAQLDLARAILRRAERRAVALDGGDGVPRRPSCCGSSTAPPTPPTRWRGSPTPTTRSCSRAASARGRRPEATRSMRVVARRRDGYTHDVEIEGGHTLVVDEPAASGGDDLGPSPTRARRRARSPPARRSPARCTRRARAGSWARSSARSTSSRAAARSSRRSPLTLRVPARAHRRAARAPARDRRQVPRPPGARPAETEIVDQRPDRGRLSADGPRASPDARASSPAPAAGSAWVAARMLCAEGASVLLVARGAERLAEAAADCARRRRVRRRAAPSWRSTSPTPTPASGWCASASGASAASTCSSTTPARPAGASSTTSPRRTGTRPGS